MVSKPLAEQPGLCVFLNGCHVNSLQSIGAVAFFLDPPRSTFPARRRSWRLCYLLKYMSLACRGRQRRQEQFKLAPSLLKGGRQLQAHTQRLEALIHVDAWSIRRNLQEKTAGRTKIDGS